MRASLAAATVLVLLFLYLPMAVVGTFSFNASDDIVVWKGFTLSWYAKAFENSQVRAAFGHTLVIGGVSTVLATILGTCAAVASVRLSFPGKRAFNTLLSLPITIPDLLMGLSLFVFFRAAGVGLGHWTVIIAHATFSLAYVAVVVAARLQGLDRSAELAAQDLGATPFGAFLRVTLPAIAPAILAGTLLAFTLSFDDVVITYFTSGPTVTTLPVYLHSRVRFGLTPEVNVLSTATLVASLVLVVAALGLHRPALEGERR